MSRINSMFSLIGLNISFKQYSRCLDITFTVKPVLSGHSKRTQNWFSIWSINAGQRYCRMLQGEHSAILSTVIKLPVSIKTFVLYILSGRLRQVLLYIVLNVVHEYSVISEILARVYFLLFHFPSFPSKHAFCT